MQSVLRARAHLRVELQQPCRGIVVDVMRYRITNGILTVVVIWLVVLHAIMQVDVGHLDVFLMKVKAVNDEGAEGAAKDVQGGVHLPDWGR